MASLGQGSSNNRPKGSGREKSHSPARSPRSPQKPPVALPSLGQSGTVPPTSPEIRHKKQPERLSLTPSERDSVFRRNRHRCQICGISPLTDQAVKLQIDHIVPVSRGGTNDPHNLQTLCSDCNRAKSNYLPTPSGRNIPA